MDPVGPWSAYAASYNRLANASSFQNATSSELHHVGGGVQSPPSSTTQLLAAHATSGLAGPAPSPFTSAGFLSPSPVGYDPVFTPLFHQKAHYGIQHRPIKQPETDAFNQVTPNNYFDQNNGAAIAWSQNSPQLPSPFGILPHESVVPNSPGSKVYENFNAHFAAAQTLNQLTDYKNSSFSDPKKRSSSPPKSITSANPFFQQMLSPPDSSTHFKQSDYPGKSFQNGHPQQACSISSPPSQGKEYRVPQLPRAQYPQQRSEKPRAFTPKQLSVQKQSAKMYDSEKRSENNSQSSPISFAMIDSQRNFQSTKLRSQQFQNIPNQQTYRYPMTPESDYQRSKSTESFGSTSSNPDCNIGLPRRPSPLHAQPSPSAHAQSPVYPMYNSPLTTISSPSPVQHDSCFNKQPTEIPPPLDVTVPRNNLGNSVITRTDNRYDRQDYNKQQWDERQRRYLGCDSQSNQSRQQYYDPGHQLTLQDLSSCRGDPMSLVKTLQQQQPEKSPEDKPKKHKKNSDKSSDSEYLPRVPPPAHHNGNQSNQSSYFDFDRWNLTSAPGKNYSTSPVAFNSQSNAANSTPSSQAQPLMVSHSGPPPPYFPPFLPQQSQPSEPPHVPEPEEVQPKVIVPNIAEELQTLLDGNAVNEETRTKKTICPNSNAGFISSFIKFLQGEKESSPPPTVKPVRKPKIYQPSDSKESTSSDVPPVPEFPSDPQDDPRYFPLPKSSDKRHFNSSDSEASQSEFPSDGKTEEKDESPLNSPLRDTQSADDKEKATRKSSKKKEKKHHKSKKKKKSKSKDSPETVVPRRELSKRKAKEKSFPLLIEDIETESSFPEFQESDSDPAWSPRKNGSDNEDASCKRVTRTSTKRKSRSPPKDSSDEDDIPVAERIKKKKHKKKSLYSSKKPSEKTQKKSPPQIIYPSKPASSSKSNNFPFSIGEFVVSKADVHLMCPPLWRVKETSMLQKFIHFVDNGTSLYRNLPFFTGWSPESKQTYEGVIVKVISATKTDMVIQLLSQDIQSFCDNERKIIEGVMQQTSPYFENFEVYIQTLFSQALDANFLIEVFQEDDEYFLLNIRAIDSLVSDMKKRLTDALSWPAEVTSAVQYYSSYKCQPKGGSGCRCGSPGIVLLTFSGLGYNKDTLQPEASSTHPSTLDIVLCRDCLSHVELLFKVCHFKRSLYGVCLEKVNEARDINPNKDTTLILDELVQNDAWLTQLFEGIRKEWGYVEAVVASLSPPTTSD